MSARFKGLREAELSPGRATKEASERKNGIW